MPKHIAVGSTALAQAKSGWSVSLKFERSDPVGGVAVLGPRSIF
jgi:hypothetical protein